MGAIRRYGRRLHAREPGEALAEPGRVPLAPRRRLGEALELGARERRGELARQVHPAAERRLRIRLVVERVAGVPLGRRLQAVEPHSRRPGVELLRIRHEEATLAYRQALGRVQAEGRHRSEGPDGPTFI